MTIINISVKRDHALMGCDTECRREDGGVFSCSKMLLLPHQHAVIAAAAKTRLLVSKVFGVVQLAARDVDGTVEAMPKFLRYAAQQAMADNEHYRFDPERVKRACIFFVGWSEKRQAFIGKYWHSTDGKEHDIEEYQIHPAFNDQPELFARLDALPRPDSPDSMARLAQEQATIMRETGHHAGGPFLCALLTREGMTIRPAGEL